MLKRELLAPAGDIEAGYAALYYGADAVYLGLAKFSARATATNFTETELDKFTAYAHHLQRKVYVALNTVLQENELPDLLQSLDICARCRVDGLIIQDLGVARVMKEKYPQFEMHASTQMAVHNKEGALFLQSMGFKRVVLARELTLAEIKEIAAIPELETEAFIHGALCYSYSGLCQFSAIESGRSANRGKCLYPCRSLFACNGKNTHFFSMKDMALQEDVLKLPVTSLKIEGRKKSAIYVAAVTDYYRRILDGKGADKEREDRIKQIFSRPWCKFHFHGKDKAVIDRDFVGHRGLFIGKVESLHGNKLGFVTSTAVSRHDGLQIDAEGEEKPFGFAVQKMFCKQKSVFTAPAGSRISVELPHGFPHIKTGDKIYLASSSGVKGMYRYEKPRENAYRNTAGIEVTVKIFADKMIAECNGVSASVSGSFAPTLQPEKSNDAVNKSFAKTGDTAFKLQALHIENPQGLFAPASVLNELRRSLYEKMAAAAPVAPQNTLPQVPSRIKPRQKPRFCLKIDNLDYLNLLNLDDFYEIIYLIAPDSEVNALARLPKNKVRIALPAVCRNPKLYAGIIDDLLERGYHKWEVANYWTLQVLPPEKTDICFDSSLYMLNTQAMTMAAEMGVSRVNLSLEDMKSNICNIIEKSPIDTSLVIYQDIPLFTSVGCIRDNDCRHCQRQPLWFDLQREGRKYKALSDHCQMMLFDEQPFCIAAEAADLAPDFFRFDFVYRRYEPRQVRDIVNNLLKFNNVTNCISGNFTKNNI